MAKKQSLSYSPNMGLIAGEAAVAGSEASLTNVGGAFAQGFTNVFAAYQKEEEERAAKMEAYAAQFPGLEQSNFMANATNKQIVTDFLNTQRDEFVRLAAIHEKTGDRKVLDQMNAIKFSITNLNDQIKVFNQDKQEYRTAFDENQLANGKTYEVDFFTNVYTDNAKFTITPNGDISFDVGGKKNTSKLYKDHAGNWNPSNNISETFALETYSKAVASGEKGNAFYRDGTYRALLNNLKSTGNDGLQTFITTDLTGDKSEFTFEEQWASGTLDDKFYKIRGKAKQQNDTDWMFDNKNANEVRKLVADYYTDVVEDGYNTGKKNYKPPVSVQKRIDKANELFGSYTDSGGDYEFGIKPIASIPREDKEERYRSLLALEGFGGVHYAYEWNGKNWEAYSLDGEKEKVKDLNGGQVARIEGLKTRNESVFNDFIISSEDVETKKENTPPSPGELSLGDIKAYKTKDIISNFSEVFKPDLFRDYDFSTILDDYHNLTKLVIKPKREGLPTVPIFTIGDEAKKDTAAEITKFFSDYLIMDTSYSDPIKS
tara:strand:+ start:139 stop:1770 length:1632 start_codon:yes stop_codon:yes gene_type:complete